MAKRDQDLFTKLRSSGVRKSVARTLSDAAGVASGRRKPPKNARRALVELRNMVGVVDDRLSGGPQKRKIAAKKAAATRKQKAAKRSAAAKKGARTRSRG